MSKFVTLSRLTRFWNNAKTYIDTALAGKANTAHTHDYAASNHTHDYAASVHTHDQNAVNGLSDALAGKAAVSHTHAQGEVSGLTAALEGKASASHTHTEYAASAHTHAEYAASGHTHSNYALKSDISTVYRYKGSVAAVANLPSGATVGDVYNVEGDNGQNYAWDGEKWDALGGSIQIEVATDDDIDALFE